MGNYIRIVLVFNLLSWLSISAQVVIWQEDFNNYQDGTVAGANFNEANPDFDWTSGGCTACIDTADWWEIRSGAMEARDVNQVVFLQTEIIDISGFSDIEFTLAVDESGDHEGLYFGLDACADQDKEDYVNILYRVDGGPWTLVSNVLGWCGLYGSCGNHTLYGDDGINSGDCRDHDDDWGSAMVNATGLTGNTLEVRIETINSATDEIIRFDNLAVKGILVLPVVLKTFNLINLEDKILLNWQTISENNNDYFEIERSVHMPDDWETIAQISGAGTSNEINNYYFEDLHPYLGRSYYRLKQIDFDGNFEYSEIKSVTSSRLASPYPNPAKDYVIIPIENNIQVSEVKLYDITSSELSVNNFSINRNQIWLDLSYISCGSYILSVSNNNYRILVVR